MGIYLVLVKVASTTSFVFHYLFPNSALITATDGAASIFAYHVMPWRDSKPRGVAPDCDL